MVISSHKIMIAGEVLLKCCQTGSKIKSKLEDISHTSDMAPIEVKDLRKGFCVMVEIDGKPYPAEFLEFTGNIFGNLMF